MSDEEKSPKFEERGKGGPKSQSWGFFTRTQKGGICRICDKEVNLRNGSTTNFRNHLRRKHEEFWNACMERRLDLKTLNISERRISDMSPNLSDMSDDNSPSDVEIAVQHIQAYNPGDTIIYLSSPQTAHMTGESNQSPATTETITANGEIVSIPIEKQKTVSSLLPEAELNSNPSRKINTPKKFVRKSFTKFYRESSPSLKTVGHKIIKSYPDSSRNSIQMSDEADEGIDQFSCFGKYVASLLKVFPCRQRACTLQGEIINLILQDQLKYGVS
ncbi:BED-type domain-containing protein [Caerostris extrusa]|uniref:BED-type domain-containing protein n=1 Tax=Caerostris extrusa TaxID=172846 RepID=A0AAV4NIZ5_CAEEX|nr:BED-type domain-containing protein [Caerostris extrusa]